MPAVRPAFAGLLPGAELIACSEREHLYLATADGSYTVGVWEAQPYTDQIDGYPGNEFCTVVRGAVTLTAHDRQAQTFRAGDSFTIEAGCTGQWRVDEPFLKFFAFSTPV